MTCDLSAVKLLIVDEADEVFAAEGADSLLPCVQEILRCVTDKAGAPPNVLLMSATFEKSAQENFSRATQGPGAWLGAPSSWSIVEVNQVSLVCIQPLPFCANTAADILVRILLLTITKNSAEGARRRRAGTHRHLCSNRRLQETASVSSSSS